MQRPSVQHMTQEAAIPLPTPTQARAGRGGRFRDLGRPFWYLWTGETIISLGTQLVQFALGVWIYQRTGSVLDFAGVGLAGLVPQLLVLPIAGNVVDRLDRRRVIIVSDCAAALMLVAVIVLLWLDRLQLVHLYAFVAIMALARAFKDPAYRASVGVLLREEQLTRASGLLGVSITTLGILAPTLAGSLMGLIQLPGVVILDLITFVAGMSFVWHAFASLSSTALADRRGALRGILAESLGNFRRSLAFFGQSAPIASLFVYSLIQTTLLALAATMATPLILANHSPQSLGLTLSFAAAGALVGSALMALFDSPRRRTLVILSCDAVLACCITGIGLTNSLLGYCVLEGLAYCAGSIGTSCAFALWISKAPEAQRGSILAVQGTATATCTALVLVWGATLVDLWLDPALAHGWIPAGIGELLPRMPNGRGIALLFLLSGGFGLMTALGGYAWKPLRNLR
jgi:MFS transporter, DHA3 family, macrolide efflux protein